MDPYTIAVMFLINTLGQPMIKFVLSVLTYIFFNEYVFTYESEVKKLDVYVTKRAYCTAIVTNRTLRIPGDGYHFLFMNYRLIIVYKTSRHVERCEPKSTYYFYTNQKNIDEIKASIASKNSIKYAWYQSTAPWRTTIDSVSCELPGKINPQQSKICKLIYSEYKKSSKASVLLFGEPGAGKSSVGYFLVQYFIDRSNGQITPELMLGYNLTMKGCAFDFYNDYMYGGNPLIIIVDEYDIAVKKALDANEEKGEFSCIAQDKTKLLGFLDQVNLMKNLILIATTNAKKEEFEEAFIRKGRFNIHYNF